MRAPPILILLAALSIASCASGGRPVQREPGDSQTVQASAPVGHDPNLSVEKQSPETWLLRVQRQLGSDRASAVLMIRCRERPGPEHSDVAVTGSFAFLLMGERRLVAGELERARAAAHEGLRELGDRYRVWKRKAVDDSAQHILAAELHFKEGNRRGGAARLLQLIRGRIETYLRENASLVWQPAEQH